MVRETKKIRKVLNIIREECDKKLFEILEMIRLELNLPDTERGFEETIYMFSKALAIEGKGGNHAGKGKNS